MAPLKTQMHAAAIGAVIALIVTPFMWLQYHVIHDCSWMAFFRGAEWWWLFGYCH